MARLQTLTMDVPVSAPNTGTALDAERYRDKTVQISGTFVASLLIEGSLDGSAFDDVTSAINTTGIFEIPFALANVRVKLIALTSGTPVVKFAGFNERVS